MRDLEHEHQLTLAAGTLLRVDPSAVEHLSRWAQARAGTGPVEMPPGRDLITEAFEEACDLRNYACWKMSELADHPDPHAAGHALEAVGEALAHACAAHAALLRARRALDGN